MKLTRIPISAYNHNQSLLLHPLSFDCTWNQMQGKPAHNCLCNEAAIKVKKDVSTKYDMKNTHLFRYFVYITKRNHSSGCNLGSRNLHIYEIQLHQIQLKIFYFPSLIYISNYPMLLPIVCFQDEFWGSCYRSLKKMLNTSKKPDLSGQLR